MPKLDEGTTPAPAKAPVKVPRLTNRGGAGLLNKVSPEVSARLKEHAEARKAARGDAGPVSGPPLWEVTPKNHIAEHLLGSTVPIDSLKHDPDNARLHPDRNMWAIKDSLCLYKQVTPIVVRRQTGIVLAGNGRLQAARELGWTEIAVTYVDMNDVEAIGFGLADNRTAELAKWDFEVHARLVKLIQAEGHEPVGWTDEEVEALIADPELFGQMYQQPGPAEENPEDVPEQEVGDAELLMKLRVTLDEPLTQVEYGQVYQLGHHLLVVADVAHDVQAWRGFLEDDMVFAPYPGPLLPLTEAAKEKRMLMVQPNFFIAGYILDQYKAVYGPKVVHLV